MKWLLEMITGGNGIGGILSTTYLKNNVEFSSVWMEYKTDLIRL